MSSPLNSSFIIAQLFCFINKWIVTCQVALAGNIFGGSLRFFPLLAHFFVFYTFYWIFLLTISPPFPIQTICFELRLLGYPSRNKKILPETCISIWHFKQIQFLILTIPQGLTQFSSLYRKTYKIIKLCLLMCFGGMFLAFGLKKVL